MKLKYYEICDSDDIAPIYIDFCCTTPASILEMRYNSVCRDLVLRMVDKLEYTISSRATEMGASEFLARLEKLEVNDKGHKLSVLATIKAVINSFELAPAIADVKLAEPLKEENGRFVEVNPLDMLPSKMIDKERRKKDKYKLKLLKLKLKFAKLQKNG